MADNSSTPQWPVPSFTFKVQFVNNKLQMSFSEVSGLESMAPSNSPQYRGNSPAFTAKMPGIQQPSKLTLKRGICADGKAFADWITSTQNSQSSNLRDTVTISLLQKSGKETRKWTLHQAWPSKISSTNIQPNDMSMAIDVIELYFETIDIQ